MISHRLLTTAEKLHYPRLLLGLQIIDAGMEGWYAFVEHASDMELERALARLERLEGRTQPKEEVKR
jgi:hypothetical protein